MRSAIKTLGYFLLLSCLPAHALVPVEGILMGEARQEIQQDPLLYIFNDIYDKSDVGQMKKLKLYHQSYLDGRFLSHRCGQMEGSTYATPWQEKQARRSVASTLQYIGLDASIKAIGAYARKLDVGEEEYKRLTQNLVRNYCSKNVTVYSLRNIERSLLHYYHQPLENQVPSISASPFSTFAFNNITEAPQARSTEFDYAIRTFRSFCSWGGDVEDYRMLSPYLRNSFIMAFVIKNMLGIQHVFDPKEEDFSFRPDPNSVQVACDELICRKVSKQEFREKFPLSVGSTGPALDLHKLYCGHFRLLDYSHQAEVPQVKKWIKESDLEDPILETNFFISLMTGVPDPFMGVDTYRDIAYLAKSSIDERWNKWAKDVLGFFSKDLLFEESLKVKALPRRDVGELAADGFKLDFHVTMGEIDRVMDDLDKLGLSFDLRLSKNYLRSLKVKWNLLAKEVDTEGQRALKKQVADYIVLQLKDKEKMFWQKMWNDEVFSSLIAEELMGQLLAYRGGLFDSYQDEVLRVPVRFSYGLFSLAYLRYRADVNAGRLKLNTLSTP